MTESSALNTPFHPGSLSEPAEATHDPSDLVTLAQTLRANESGRKKAALAARSPAAFPSHPKSSV